MNTQNKVIDLLELVRSKRKKKNFDAPPPIDNLLIYLNIVPARHANEKEMTAR